MRQLVVLSLSIALSGCMGAPSQTALEEASADAEAAGITSDVIVALIDTGIQPYHDAFKAPPDWQPPKIPGAISLGEDFQKRVLADLGVWNELQPNQIYYFESTRVFAVSKFHHSSAVNARDNPHVIYDDEVGELGHGTGTASLVAQASPHATILMVESSGSLNNAWIWVRDQPWIDVVSVSQGAVANLPDTDPGPDRDAHVTQQIVGNGKLVVGSAGNQPTPNVMDATAAPWVIAVGGAEERTRGETIITSKLADVVANFTSDRVANKSDLHGYFRNGGTSMGTPVVAGTLAEALYELRHRYRDPGVRLEHGALVDATGKTITNADLREALNATAAYWDTTQYDPTNYTYTQPFELLGLTVPILPAVWGTSVGPWTQMGWGFVDERLVPDLVAILSGEKPMPEKPADAVRFMDQVAEIKAKYWEIRQRS